MTVAELRQGVALLGFEQTIEALDDTAENHFWHCVKRGIWTLNRLRPQKGIYTLCHYPAKNLLPYGNHRHIGGVSLCFSVFGAKTYSFSVCGTGTCTLKDGTETLTLSFENENHRRFCGFLLGGEVSLCFEGEMEYTVFDLALWDSKTSNKREDIPEGQPFVRYDLKALIPDFLRLDDKPFFDTVPKDIKTEDMWHITLPRTTEGCFPIRYRKKRQEITEDTPPDTLLPLDEDLCQLLPLLVAEELCLDTDKDKAAYYHSLYREQAREIMAEPLPYTPTVYISHNNW